MKVEQEPVNVHDRGKQGRAVLTDPCAPEWGIQRLDKGHWGQIGVISKPDGPDSLFVTASPTGRTEEHDTIEDAVRFALRNYRIQWIDPTDG